MRREQAQAESNTENARGKVQCVRLNEEAKAILSRRQIQEIDRNVVSPYVYPSETLATPLDQRNFYARVFRPAVLTAKLDGDGVGQHTLRHTFASRLAMSGQTKGTIATLLRHSTTTLVRRDAHLSPFHYTPPWRPLPPMANQPKRAYFEWNRTRNRKQRSGCR
jgi:integrase